MNANAYATRNQRELSRAAPSAVEAGRESAKWAASIVNPNLVIAYGKEMQIPDTLREICDRFVPGKAKTIHQLVEFYEQANWNGKSVRLAHIKIHLAARKGVTDGLFSDIGKAIKTAFNSLGPAVADVAPHVENPARTSQKPGPPQMPPSGDCWRAFFRSHFAIFGDGMQVSRDAYRLQGDPRRLFKVEQRGLSSVVISFMTKNFDVDPQTLCKRLQECGFETRVKPRYVEVEIQSLQQATCSLNAFLAVASLGLV